MLSNPHQRSAAAAPTPPPGHESGGLVVEHLGVDLYVGEDSKQVVRDVSFRLDPGETVAVVGESGCGKSTLARTLIGLVDNRMGVVSGSIRLDGFELVNAPETVLESVRGRTISMIFQDSTDSLDPVFSIGYQLKEVLRNRAGLGRQAAHERAVQLLRDVEIADAEQRMADYPHQLSGGMRQRVAIALAIATHPRALIADEPTTALDVTVQMEVLKVIQRLVRERGMSLIFITHDLGVARRIADRIMVMYAGQVVESGPLQEILQQPAHPYTIGLRRSEPASFRHGERLRPIPGSPPAAFGDIQGCALEPRCSFAQDRCGIDPPDLDIVVESRRARCHFAREVIQHDPR